MSHIGNGILLTALAGVVFALAIFGAAGIACVMPITILAATEGSKIGITSAIVVAAVEIWIWVKYFPAK